MPAESLASPSSLTGEPGGVGSTSLAVRARLSREPFRFALRPEFRTQRQIEDWFSRHAGLNRSLAEKAGGPLVDARQSGGQNPTPSLPEDPVALGRLKEGLFDLASNVILFESRPQSVTQICLPVFISGSECRTRFRSRPSTPQYKISFVSFNIDYFFRRQDEFWRREALTKLPALKRVTNMLICGEDLGMVPATVPEVMHNSACSAWKSSACPSNCTACSHTRPRLPI